MTKTTVVLGLALAMVCGRQAPARARSLMAAFGNPADSSIRTCFDVSRNTGWIKLRSDPSCPTDPIWELLAPVDSNGSKTVTMTVDAPDSSTFCRSVGIAKNGTMASSSPFVSPSAFNRVVDMTLSGAVLPSFGILYIDCNVGVNASMIKADYP